MTGDRKDNHIDGGLSKDIIDGGTGDDFIYDNDGSRDIIWGGAGHDTISFSGSQNAITIDVANKSTSHGDYIHGIEAFIGTDFDDTFNGDNNDNGFTGGFGKDSVNGFDGDDIFFDSNDSRDLFWGGSGNDTVSYAGSQLAMTIDLFGEYTSADDYIHGVENIIATDFDDYIFGNDQDNIINSGAGWDFVDFGDGNDTVIDVDNGLDDYWGGDGIDTISFAGSSERIIFSFKDGKSNFGDHTQGFENFIGTDFDDVVFANETRNILTGGAGADIFHFETTGDSNKWHRDYITDFETGIDKISFGSDINLSDLLVEVASWGSMIRIPSGDAEIHIHGNIDIINDILIAGA